MNPQVFFRLRVFCAYAKQSKDDEMEKLAQRIRARAVRRCGQLLAEIEKASGQRTDLQPIEGTHNRLTRRDAASQAGLSDHQTAQALRVANVPESDFEEQLESDTPPTVTKLAEQGTQTRHKGHRITGKPAFSIHPQEHPGEVLDALRAMQGDYQH